MSALYEDTAAAFARVQATLERKNRDYAGEVDPWRCFRSAELVGVNPGRAILGRLLDKVSRCATLLDADPAVAGESLADSADDLIGYAGLFAAWLADERRRQG